MSTTRVVENVANYRVFFGGMILQFLEKMFAFSSHITNDVTRKIAGGR